MEGWIRKVLLNILGTNLGAAGGSRQVLSPAQTGSNGSLFVCWSVTGRMFVPQILLSLTQHVFFFSRGSVPQMATCYKSQRIQTRFHLACQLMEVKPLLARGEELLCTQS